MTDATEAVLSNAVPLLALHATLGEGFMKGQMLSPPVKVLRVRRVPIPAPAS